MNTKLAVLFVSASIASMGYAQSFNFDNAVVTGSTQAPGTWYTDRFAPAGFESQVMFGGDNRLKQTISATDSEAGRPSGFSSSFYNTQGRKYDLNPGTTSMSIDLFVDSTWEMSGRRMAGFWGTAFDSSDAISAYPIVEFNSNGTTGGFRVYDTLGNWNEIGTPSGFTYGSWVTLNIAINGGNFDISAGDATISIDNGGSTYLGNVILQGHNTATGVDYDIHWDNLNAVPEPTTMGILALAGLAALRRKAKK